MTENTQIVTVLTGDLVNSTALGAEKVEIAFERLQEVAKDLEAWHGGSLLFTRHRGDGWQVVLREPKFALRSALVFRAGLKAIAGEFDTYMSLLDGDVEFTEQQDLNTYTEPVFTYSGRFLELIKREAKHGRRMAIFNDDQTIAISSLADQIVNRWTKAQASAVYHFLMNENTTYSQVGDELGISRQAVSKSLESAGFFYVETALDSLENDHD
ncbi:hypothetical protein [Cognatishimia activa]|uniref:Uncharacterized protein n=1 Tax=Cognatishimia activa TaxID=1715691 RepID=A0A975EPI8_9RHOB|nr:hypothetical protein [Cognatishimia activa]QTN35512.1 hypothetical protein HZ995_13660 [Cognatishimia activa]